MAEPSHVLVAGAFHRIRNAPTGVLPVAPLEIGMIASTAPRLTTIRICRDLSTSMCGVGLAYFGLRTRALPSIDQVPDPTTPVRESPYAFWNATTESNVV